MKTFCEIKNGPATLREQALAVRQYALMPGNYENGWDVIAECYSLADIEMQLDGCKTRWGAIERIRKNECVDVRHSIKLDIQGA